MSGIVAEVTGSPLDRASVSSGELLRAAAEAQRGALAGWAKDRRGLGARLAEDAMSRFGFTPRRDDYMNRVRRAYGGRYLPYVSPKRAGNKLLTTLTVPGTGHQVVQVDRSAGERATVLQVPGARGLNFKAGGKVDAYKDEWERLYPFEGTALEERAAPGLDQALTTWTRQALGT